MTERASQLQRTADSQIAELLGLISTLDEDSSGRLCPGRESLGDGTIAACARHTAENYQRIAAFVTTSERMATTHQRSQHDGHRVPRFIRSRGHRPQSQTEHGPDDGSHDGPYTADDTDLGVVGGQLSATRERMAQIADLTDNQLDAIPPEGAFRFCDGQRTLEHVLASLFKHQAHQLNALKAAV
jgi:hypothetical protein